MPDARGHIAVTVKHGSVHKPGGCKNTVVYLTCCL